MAGGPPHMDSERSNRDRRYDGQDAFPERLIGRAGEQEGGADTDRHGERYAPPDGGNEFPAPALLQVRKADGDDEEGFKTFAQGDDKRLDHGSGYQKR